MAHPRPWMLVVPASLVLVATLEALWLDYLDGSYDWKAYFASFADLVLRTASGLLPLGLAAGALSWMWNYRFYTMPLGEAWPWAVLLFSQDFCYYWMHRAITAYAGCGRRIRFITRPTHSTCRPRIGWAGR